MFIKRSTAGWLIILAIFLDNIFGGSFIACLIYGIIFAVLLDIFSFDPIGTKVKDKKDDHREKTKR